MKSRLMMKLFIGSEAFFFLSLIVAYLYFWRSAHFTQEALHYLNVKLSGVYTALLLLSSGSLVLAENRQRKRAWRSAHFWLAITIVLGCIFIAGQAHEYLTLISEDLTLGSSEFGSGFFTLTGFHGLHVVAGLVLLAILLGLLLKGHLKKEDALRTAGMYWHFVDAVWLCVFTLIYVLPHYLSL